MPGVATIIAKLASFLGTGFVDRLLTHLERRADSETERQRITALREQNAQNTAASVIIEGMKHWPFWVAWSIAALPTAAWFGWGMADSLFNGALPDVAALPPQLKEYADIVFGNIFYSGAALGGAQMIASAIRRRG